MIKNIVFDLGGVVLPLTPEEAWSRFESLGIKNARQQMGLYGQTGIFLKVENGELTADQFIRELNMQAQAMADNKEVVEYIGYDKAQWAWKGYLENVELFRLNNLKRLKNKYNVLLLSNINPFVVEWASSDEFSGDGHPISYYFNQLYYSYELKDYKPSESIFLKLIEMAGIVPQETIFLDDGPKNIHMAEKMGIHGLLVKNNDDWMPLLNEQLKLYNS